MSLAIKRIRIFGLESREKICRFSDAEKRIPTVVMSCSCWAYNWTIDNVFTNERHLFWTHRLGNHYQLETTVQGIVDKMELKNQWTTLQGLADGRKKEINF